MKRGSAMSRRSAIGVCLFVLAFTASAHGDPLDANRLLTCQKQIASQGARFAKVTLKNALRCTNEIVECQINCEEGVYGPSCEEDPPPCCDPDDPGSNPSFGTCMSKAEDYCLDLEFKTRGRRSPQGRGDHQSVQLAHDRRAMRRPDPRLELRDLERGLRSPDSRV
jgi:hypothetical protein